MALESGASAAAIKVLHDEAEGHASRRDWARAIACHEAALVLAPEDPHTLVQLSYVHSMAGHYRLARAHALRAAATGTNSPPVLKDLAARLRTFNEVPALLGCIERMRPLSRMPIPLLLAFASQLTYLGQAEQAIAFLDEAHRADPDYPPTLLSRAQVLLYLGRFTEAGRDVQRAVQRAPQLAQGYWLQAQVARQTPDDNHVPAIRRRMAQPVRTPEEAALLAFALHKELDDLGDHAGGWEALAHGCRYKRAALKYEPAGTSALFAALQAWEPPQPRATQPATTDPASRTPVFIVGMHRSGTTLLEQLLDGHSRVRGLGELYDFTSAMRFATDHHCRGVIDRRLVERAGAVDLAGVGQRYLDGVAWRLGGEPLFVDKLPSNFHHVGFICEALPQARILHMVRDPAETCFSNLRELFSDANPYSYDQRELADYFNHYRRLMAHWHARYPGRILDVDYARLTRDPGAEMRRVAAFCGIDFEPGMLETGTSTRGVVTASAVQVRGRVHAREQPKWAPYARWLQPLLDGLAET